MQWHSYELRPKDAPPISPAYRAQIEAKRPTVYATGREIYGVEMNAGPFGIDSRPALIGAKYAEDRGKGIAYTERVLKAYWQDAENIEEITVLRRIAGDVGLDPDELEAALSDPTYIEQVDNDIATAAAYGLSGVPAIVVENKYLIPGAVPFDTLRDAVDQIAAQTANGQ